MNNEASSSKQEPPTSFFDENPRDIWKSNLAQTLRDIDDRYKEKLVTLRRVLREAPNSEGRNQALKRKFCLGFVPFFFLFFT